MSINGSISPCICDFSGCYTERFVRFSTRPESRDSVAQSGPKTVSSIDESTERTTIKHIASTAEYQVLHSGRLAQQLGSEGE